MRVAKISSVLATILLLTACASVKTLTPTGGSRSDGVVELSYEFGMFEKPQVDWAQGLVLARQRCQAWGYPEAEAFGGSKSQCQAFNGYGSCVRTFVTTSYQCTGSNQPGL